MPDIELTPDEKRAIRALKRVAKNWPKSLWLYSGSGTLNIMRCNADGERVHTGGHGPGVDPAYCVDTASIPNDGGDW